MANKRKHKQVKQFAFLPRGIRVYIIALGILMLLLVSIIFTSDYQVLNREAQRQKIATEINYEIYNFKAIHNTFPRAVFFTDNEAELCLDVSCFIQSGIVLEGSNKPNPRPENYSDKSSTKYYYKYMEDTYHFAYCDEFGNVKSFGNSIKPLEFFCTKNK